MVIVDELGESLEEGVLQPVGAHEREPRERLGEEREDGRRGPLIEAFERGGRPVEVGGEHLDS